MLLKTSSSLSHGGRRAARRQHARPRRSLSPRCCNCSSPASKIMARALAERPALQLMQQANMALQQVAPERREAIARDDRRRPAQVPRGGHAHRARPRHQAGADRPSGRCLKRRFTEEELRQVIAMLESPVDRKFQAMAADMQKAIGEKLVADVRRCRAKVRVMEQSVRSRMSPTLAARRHQRRRGRARGRNPDRAAPLSHCPLTFSADLPLTCAHGRPDRAARRPAGPASVDRRGRPRAADAAEPARRAGARRGRDQEARRLGRVPARARGAGHRRR